MQINIEKRHLVIFGLILGGILILLSGIFVYAASNPAVFGHSSNDIAFPDHFNITNANGGYILLNSVDGGLELASGNDELSYIDFKGKTSLSRDFSGRILYDNGTHIFSIEGGDVSIPGDLNVGGTITGAGSGGSSKIFVPADSRGVYFPSTNNNNVASCSGEDYHGSSIVCNLSISNGEPYIRIKYDTHGYGTSDNTVKGSFVKSPSLTELNNGGQWGYFYCSLIADGSGEYVRYYLIGSTTLPQMSGFSKMCTSAALN